MLFALTLFGAGFSRLLILAGLQSMIWRNLAVMSADYVFFFGLVSFWLRWLRDNKLLLETARYPWLAPDREDPEYPAATENQNTDPKPSTLSRRHSKPDYLGQNPLTKEKFKRNISRPFELFDLTELFDPKVIIFTILAAASVCLVFFAGSWLYGEVGALLVDTAFDVSLAVGLGQAAGFPTVPERRWWWRVLRRTSLPFLFILIASSAIMGLAHHKCPGAVRLSQAVPVCRALAR